ncbi:MAG TPA: redox-regulated ATPase YchF [Patescibacteria group bacterium]
MSLSVGIVGLPNVGKSTLFNALLKQQAALAANYPFATIEPNVGIVPVPDPRLEKLAEVVKTTTIKPATVEFLDIAGLVKGASEGEGLGNKFLANIRETDLIAHVVRDFSDQNVLREGSVDAKTDLETIQMELLLADLSTLEKQKEPKASKDKAELEKWAVVQRLQTAAAQGRQLREVLHDESDRLIAKELNLLTTKPVLYVINVDEDQVGDSDSLIAKYAQLFNTQPDTIVIISAKIESELSSLSDEDQKAYLKDLGLEQSGLERLIAKAYKTLGLQSFLTAGEKEVKAWTIKQGTTAPQAAGVIHTDFEKHFIKAIVASYDDFIAHNGWKPLRELGKVRQEGRDYVMREGDVVEFMIGK